MSRISVATIDNPEFINLQPLDINPLMSKCEIKVLYVGENRNRSYISKEVAVEMAKSLRGAPIVGWYREETEDYFDHGDRVTIDGEGIKFESLTKPYGFVSPDAEVWFQKFEDTDDFGNTIEHEYLMTTGYLWTGQYEEAQLPINEGRPQSMELDEETLNGHWAENSKSGIEFFIINDAIFSKLCILGEDVEPCFEGANVTAPEISSSFTLDDDFKQTLYNMMKQLKFALEGGEQMPNEVETPNVENEEKLVNTEEVNDVAQDFSVEQDNIDESVSNESENSTEGQENIQDNADTSYTENADSDKYALLEEQFNELQEKYTALQTENEALVEFKNQVETAQKRALIDKFFMLTDEDKQDVITNMAKYTLDEIEAKLSVICVRKKVNFNLEEEETSNTETQEQGVATYNLDYNEEDAVPAWIAACRNTKNSKNN